MKLFQKLKGKRYLFDIFYVFLATRLTIFILPILFSGFTDFTGNMTLMDVLSQWDGQWYLRVAKEGYHWSGPDVQANVAFFPLYPLLAKVLSLLTGNLELSFFIVSLVSFFIFLIFLYKIAQEHFDKDTGFRTIWYLSIFPLSFVFSIFYTESLFMMLTAGAIYFAYKKKWMFAVLFSILSTLTRLSGLVLLPTLTYYYFKSNKKYKLSEIIQISAIPMGIILFSIYLKFKVGDYLAFVHVLKAWHIVYQNPFLTLLSTLGLINSLPPFNYFTAIAILDLFLFIFFVSLLILSYRRLPRELFLYCFLIFLLYIFKSWDPAFFYPLGSMNRYLYEAFPLFLTLAKLGKNRLFDLTYTTFSLTLLGLLSLSFFSGKWVF